MAFPSTVVAQVMTPEDPSARHGIPMPSPSKQNAASLHWAFWEACGANNQAANGLERQTVSACLALRPATFEVLPPAFRCATLTSNRNHSHIGGLGRDEAWSP